MSTLLLILCIIREYFVLVIASRSKKPNRLLGNPRIPLNHSDVFSLSSSNAQRRVMETEMVQNDLIRLMRTMMHTTHKANSAPPWYHRMRIPATTTPVQQQRSPASLPPLFQYETQIIYL